MTIIDPIRDGLNGKWEKDGSLLRIAEGREVSKLYIPFDTPAEYKFRMRVAREPGAGVTDELHVSLPFANSQADIVLDGGGAAISGLHLDFRNFPDNVSTHRGTIIPNGPAVELVFYVRRTGLKVARGEETIINWTGNPERMTWQHHRTIPGPRIALGSWQQRFRFEKLTIEPLEPSSFPPIPSLGVDGKLLPIINVARDARIGEWKQERDELTCPATAPARLRIPVPVPPRYVFSAMVERKEGDRQLNLGLVVGGHPCLVAIDADHLHHAGIDVLDGKRHFDPINPTHRNYSSPRIPSGQSVQVRCFVLPDTIIVTCADKEVIRWHGDPRRLSDLAEVIPPRYSEDDRSHLWLGSWESGFWFRDLELKPLADAAAAEILNSFSGVFPTAPQTDVPLAAARFARKPRQRLPPRNLWRMSHSCHSIGLHGRMRSPGGRC